MTASMASRSSPPRASYMAKFVAALATLAILAIISTLAFGNDDPAPPDIESLGLAIETEIQAGSIFEVTVPMDPATSIVMAAAPPGVEADVVRTESGDAIVLSVAVDASTPRGAYNLALLVNRDGAEHRLAWPFEVVEPST